MTLIVWIDRSLSGLGVDVAQRGAREIDVQLLLGHSTPEMVRRYTASYNVEQAARRDAAFSPLLLMSQEPRIL